MGPSGSVSPARTLFFGSWRTGPITGLTDETAVKSLQQRRVRLKGLKSVRKASLSIKDVGGVGYGLMMNSPRLASKLAVTIASRIRVLSNFWALWSNTKYLWTRALVAGDRPS